MVVQAAVAVLDDAGAAALTFRALAARLRTGAGALYHHVGSKQELLQAAALQVLGEPDDAGTAAPPQDRDHDAHRAADELRALMEQAYAALTARPWLAAQLASAPWQPAVLSLLDRVGSRLDQLGVPPAVQFDAASLLVQHLLGVAGQRAAAAAAQDGPAPREQFLQQAAGRAAGQAPHPFLDRIGAVLVDHDDHRQFTAGVDIVLAGVAALSARNDAHSAATDVDEPGAAH